MRLQFTFRFSRSQGCRAWHFLQIPWVGENRSYGGSNNSLWQPRIANGSRRAEVIDSDVRTSDAGLIVPEHESSHIFLNFFLFLFGAARIWLYGVSIGQGEGADASHSKLHRAKLIATPPRRKTKEMAQFLDIGFKTKLLGNPRHDYTPKFLQCPGNMVTWEWRAHVSRSLPDKKRGSVRRRVRRAACRAHLP